MPVAIDRATAVASGGTHRTLRLAADHPERIEAVAFVGPKSDLVEDPPSEVGAALAAGDLDRFLNVFMAAAFSEPHSTKAFEDGVEWGHGTTMEILRTAFVADRPGDLAAYRSICERIGQPVRVIQGSGDRLTPPHHGRSLVEAIGENAEMILIEGGGHRGDLRDPVLDRYRAGRRMDLATTTADDLATAIVDELDRPLDYLPVETDAAQRAAEFIHELV